MVGQGVLRECLEAPDVEQVLCIRRSSSGPTTSRAGGATAAPSGPTTSRPAGATATSSGPTTSERGPASSKRREVVLPDVSDLSSIEGQLAACDACFFCLG